MISVVVLVVDALPTFLRRLHPAPSATASACRPPASPLPTTPLADHVPKPPPPSASSTCQIVIAERCRTMVKNSRRQQAVFGGPHANAAASLQHTTLWGVLGSFQLLQMRPRRIGDRWVGGA